MSDAKLDIFHTLSKINDHDVQYFASLTEEQNKQLHPYVVQRWLTGTSAELQVLLINEHSNTKLFNFAQNHRSLVWFLLLASTIRSKIRYTWEPSFKKTSQAKKPVSVGIIKQAYNYSTSQAEEAVKFYTMEGILNLAESYGNQQEVLIKIKKEFGTPLSKQKVSKS